MTANISGRQLSLSPNKRPAIETKEWQNIGPADDELSNALAGKAPQSYKCSEWPTFKSGVNLKNFEQTQKSTEYLTDRPPIELKYTSLFQKWA